MDRLWHGVRRIAALTGRTHVLIRVKSDIVLKKTSEVLPDGSYRAEISGEGITITVRVIEYDADIEGQDVKEMFCLVTDLLDWQEYPALELSGLYKWRWDGSETGLREAKAPLHGAGPGTGAMLRSGSPALIAQEIAAWAASTEMTRGVTRDAALAAAPAKKGRRAGQPVRCRDLSLTRARRLILAAIRSGRASYKALTSRSPDTAPSPAGTGTARASPSLPARSATPPKDTVTRTAPAVITLANKPARTAETPPPPAKPLQNTQTARPARGNPPAAARHASSRHAQQTATTQRHQKGNRPSRPKCLNPVALGMGRPCRCRKSVWARAIRAAVSESWRSRACWWVWSVTKTEQVRPR